ncbi:hypothetical protein E8E12_006315 [Didymella heteroderae]|uniref:DUF6604 domain-containing protein n=1 Tax=Didymella heteroderae TaxID=1769908 RepID=A0A9P4WMK2_9PLEO|nr:hypothetical protein E8E12_006315 [Didymella heteroderae]
MATHFEPPLGNTFEAYHQATNDVVQWVASTARATGSVTSLFTVRSTEYQSFIGKLKDGGIPLHSSLDKLEGQKHPPTNPTKQTASVPSSQEIVISYETLGKLGRAIANTNKVEVHYNVLCVRNQEKGLVTEEIKQNNKWRRRVIRVLEELLKDLQSRPPGPTQSEVIDKLAAPGDRCDSIIDGVHDLEIAESLYYTRSIPIPKTNDDIIYKLKGCLEDTAFHVYCCMQDATYLRLFSARAWREFALGSIGVQTATFCTNSAIDQLGRMSERLRRTLDHLNDDDWMTRMHIKIDLFMRQHIANDLQCEDTHPDSIDPAFEDVSLARHAVRKLGFYASTLQCSRLSTLLTKAFLTQKYLHPADTLEERRLLKSLAQLRCLEWSNDLLSKTLKSDLTYGAARGLVLGHMDTKAVFAAQMLYDIQQETDPQNCALENILETLALDYLRMYDKYSAEWKAESPNSNRSTRTKQMEDQYRFLRHLVYSESNIQVDLERYEQATPRQYAIPRFNILRHVPLLIGQLVFRYYQQFHEAFLDITNDRGHILAAMHLYNAAKKSGSLPPGARWDDMEWVIDSQVKLNLSGGSPTDTGLGFLKRFCDAYGLKSGKFTNGHKLTNPEQVKNDIHRARCSPKRLECGSKYAKACSEIRRLPESEKRDFRFRMLQAFADYQLDAFPVHGSPHSIGLLIAAKEMCEDDEEALGFDIFALHMTCKRLLSSIRRACFEYAPDDYPGIRYDGTEGLNTTIAELLRDLLDCPRHHGKMWPLAIRVMTDVIRQEGTACEEIALEHMRKTTMDSISLDSEDTDSSTMSASSAIKAPPPEPMEVNDQQRESETFGALNLRSDEDGEEPHRPSKRPKLDLLGPFSRVDPERSEEWHRLQQLTIRELSNLRVVNRSPRFHHLVSPMGKTLSSWASGEAPQMAE